MKKNLFYGFYGVAVLLTIAIPIFIADESYVRVYTKETIKEVNEEIHTNQPIEAEVVDEETIKYVEDMAELLENLQIGFEKIEDLDQSLIADPFLIEDKEWQHEISVALLYSYTFINDFNKLQNVPMEFNESHQLLLQAITEFEYYLNNYVPAIESYDWDYMNKVNEAKKNGYSFIKKSKDKFPRSSININ